MTLPSIDDANAKKPLCYDPIRKKYITYYEIVSKQEKIIPIEELSSLELKLLVIERQKTGPDYSVQSISGPSLSRNDVIDAIISDDPIGRMTVEAERAYLHDLLNQIALGLE